MIFVLYYGVLPSTLELSYTLRMLNSMISKHNITTVA